MPTTSPGNRSSLHFPLIIIITTGNEWYGPTNARHMRTSLPVEQVLHTCLHAVNHIKTRVNCWAGDTGYKIKKPFNLLQFSIQYTSHQAKAYTQSSVYSLTCLHKERRWHLKIKATRPEKPKAKLRDPSFNGLGYT